MAVSVETVYCPHCHLRTPKKQKCTHCGLQIYAYQMEVARQAKKEVLHISPATAGAGLN
jgi:uncharacterized paraquat-inducible protein A